MNERETAALLAAAHLPATAHEIRGAAQRYARLRADCDAMFALTEGSSAPPTLRFTPQPEERP